MCRYIGWNRLTGQEVQTLSGTSGEITQDQFCVCWLFQRAQHMALR
jgi:hypothetical protein